MEKKVFFRSQWLPYALLSPQLGITLVFFIWPASEAVYYAFFFQEAFSGDLQFVGFENFQNLLIDPLYRQSFITTGYFSFLVAFFGILISLTLAFFADRVVRGGRFYRTLLVWPYAVAPAVAGVIWMFLFSPSTGIVSHWLRGAGMHWDHTLNGNQAMSLVVIAATWKQISYNFLFFFASLQAVPRSLIEAAAIDGAGPIRRFFDLVIPLISPTAFFLLVVNIVYAFFDTFAIIDTVTQGGPGQATQILIYKVFKDGFHNHDLGSSSAQSAILMLIVIVLTFVQFRYVERKVQY